MQEYSFVDGIYKRSKYNNSCSADCKDRSVNCHSTCRKYRIRKLMDAIDKEREIKDKITNWNLNSLDNRRDAYLKYSK